jgi:hypothetical protein
MRPPAIPYLLAALLLVFGLLVAPRAYHNYDVVDCFLAWARASGGTRPWDVYRPGVAPDDCDYPPLVPYLLTLAEAARRALHAPQVSALSVTLVKLPSLLVQAAAVPFLWRALRGTWGERRALLAGVLVALSPALFVNTAAWGQFDVLLAFFMVAALLALLRDRPVWAGVAMGFALATKLLAIVPVPLFALWVARRHGMRKLAIAAAAGLGVVLALALPHVLGGAGKAVAKAYSGAVNYYPFRTGEAYNGWYLLDRYDIAVRGLPGPVARRDDRAALGPLTFRDLSLAAFAVYTLFLLAVLWRRGTARTLLWATAMQLFAFFMLPTQVHQRYVIPAVAVLGLLAPLSPRGLALFAGLTVTAALNQGLDLLRALPWTSPIDGALTGFGMQVDVGTIKDVAALVAAANVGLFVWATVAFVRETAAPGDAEPLA